MINMRFVDIGMKRGINAGRTRIKIKRTMGQISHHFVFELFTAIEAFECAQLIHIKGRKPVELHAADVTT